MTFGEYLKIKQFGLALLAVIVFFFLAITSPFLSIKQIIFAILGIGAIIASVISMDRYFRGERPRDAEVRK